MVTLLTLGLLLTSRLLGRDQDEEKVKKLFQDAIQALGGDTFLRVTDMVSVNLFYSAKCCKANILMQNFRLPESRFFHQVQLIVQRPG